MSIKAHTSYTAEIDGHEFPIPFPYLEDSEILRISDDGQTARLGVLVQDEDFLDPLEGYDDGVFVQHDRYKTHYGERLDLEEAKRLIHANPGRVVTVRSGGYSAYIADGEPFTVEDTKGEDCRALELCNATGYYVAPKDVADPASYAKSTLHTYSDWCNGECYGVCVWSYTRTENGWELDEYSREECWGFIGYRDAQEELTCHM
ncbi:MAG: hypothetical protein RBR35_17845 [Salinivirgaceae bacterium]|nr:hypothetical protein [Salinivirgaceae bacterium]